MLRVRGGVCPGATAATVAVLLVAVVVAVASAYPVYDDDLEMDVDVLREPSLQLEDYGVLPPPPASHLPRGRTDVHQLAAKIMLLRQYLRNQGNGGADDEVARGITMDTIFDRLRRRDEMRKRGPGSCINSCLGAMSFIRCKSMCH